MDLLGTSAASAGNERPDVLLGVSWPTWGRWAGSTWLVLFAVSWVGMLRAWAGDMVTSLWLPGVVLACVIGANGVPGAAALCHSAFRRRLLSLPEAAALASLTLSAAVGIGGFTTASLLMGENMGVVGAGILIGIVAFPLSFGLVFPLGIPFGCSFVVWSSIHASGGISQTAYVLLTSVAAVGWVGVVLIGAALGVA